MKLATLLSSLTMLWVCSAFCQTNDAFDFSRLDVELRSVITNTTSSDEVLLQAISRLGKVTEPPEFWTKIADDQNYSLSHRRRAVFALFRRHVSPGSLGLKQLGEVLAPAKWMRESGAWKISGEVMGPVPVTLNLGESVFRISVLHGPAIYLRVVQDLDEYDFKQLLKKESVRSIKDDIILEVGFTDDYENWLFENALTGRTAAKPKSTKQEAGAGFSRVKFKVSDQWVNFEELGQIARAALKQKNLLPPLHIMPVFDLFPGQKSFLRVMFPQGIGKECCYVEFDRDGKVLVAASGITEG